MKFYQLNTPIKRFKEVTLADGEMNLAHTSVRDSEVVDDFDLTVRVSEDLAYIVRLSVEEAERAANWFNKCLIDSRGKGLALNSNNLEVDTDETT